MTQEGFKRKLAAILNADVVGYSRLMRDDEEATVRNLAAHQVLITEIIQQHNGRVIDSPGDNILAEFASVVDAVNGAIEIQAEIKRWNTGIPEDRRMEFRIGINLGDVIEEKDRIYGNGVNIAARVEGLATSGGIAISGTVYEHIKEKLSLGYHYLGEQNVKNISEPVRVYRLLTKPADAGKMKGEERFKSKRWLWAASGTLALIILVVGGIAIWKYYFRPSFKLASVEKPSIAVLPFDNLSGDVEQEYFADGVTDELITNLSKISGLLIISRNSSFTYKGKPTKIEQVAKELDVRYVLEGSVQRAGDRVRIRAQLIDAVTDHHLWAESYEGVMGNIFGLQDEITRKIASALAIKLAGEEQKYFGIKDTDNLEAYDAFLKGREYLGQGTPDGFAKALSYYKLAIELDPNYSKAHAKIAYLYILSSSIGFSPEWRERLGVRLHRARLLARKHLEIAMDKPTSTAHVAASSMALFRRHFDEAKTHAEHALSIDPNDPDAYSAMAKLLIFTGKPQQSIEFVKKSMRLDPHDISLDLYWLALAHLCMREYEKAATIAERAIVDYPDTAAHWGSLARSYAHLGRIQEAKSAYEKSLRGWGGSKPDLAISMVLYPFKSTEYADIVADGLLKSGCPGQPSGYYKIYAKNRLTGKEVRHLTSGHKLNLFYGEYPFGIDHNKDGKVNFEGFGQSYSGTWRIQEDTLCYRWERPDLQGLDDCLDIYRNPESAPDSKEEYFAVADHGIFPFSVDR